MSYISRNIYKGIRDTLLDAGSSNEELIKAGCERASFFASQQERKRVIVIAALTILKNRER